MKPTFLSLPELEGETDFVTTACMRMRKLAKGQSVIFYIPEEIQTKICQATGKLTSSDINVFDVLSWAIFETGADLKQSMPLWACQGQRFVKHRPLWSAATTGKGIEMGQEQAECFLEDEAQTIEHRYRPYESANRTTFLLPNIDQNPSLQEIHNRCNEFDCLRSAAAMLQEEQERELSPEVEQERQVERPAPAKPLPHALHPDVISFVRTGRPRVGSASFVPAFRALRNTTAARHLDVHQFPPTLLVTRDFAQTVELSGAAAFADAYQRPVQWILTSTQAEGEPVRHVVIISPFEAQELMPQIGTSMVHLHLYAPRWTLDHPSLDDLKLYIVPSVRIDWGLPPPLTLLLNLFSGQLYMNSYATYSEACDFLGLAWRPTGDGERLLADGFILGRVGDMRGAFSSSPVKFLNVLMTKIRRNCESIQKTHWGKVLGGEILEMGDFDARTSLGHEFSQLSVSY